MLGRHALLVLALPLVLSSCAARPGASRAPGPSATPAVVDPLAPPWAIATGSAPRAQRLILSARLRTAMDTLVREDSVESALTVEWALVPGAVPQQWTGAISDFRVRVNADTALAPDGVVFPVRFAAVVQGVGAQPAFLDSAAEPCDRPSAGLVQGWRELWVAPPPVLRPGSEWQDSTTYVVCRDGIPLQVTSLRRYVAESAVLRDSVVHVVVVRRSRVALEGFGLQFGDSVRVIGGGSSTVRLLLPVSGQAMTGEGEGVLTLELRGRRRTQRLTQESRLEIRAP